jgi:hypothetical protein
MITQRAASRADWVALLGSLGITHPLLRHRNVLLNIACGRAWVFVAQNGQPVALGGIVHTKDESECWFLPGADADHHMLGLVRLFRRQIGCDVQLSGAPVVARVSVDNAAGTRLAQCLGFQRISRDGRVITWQRESDRCLKVSSA